MGMYLTLAWRNIWRNKRRSLISIASVLFAVIIALFTRSMQLGSYRHMIHNVVSFYTGYVQVHSAGYWQKQTLEKSFVYSDSLERLAGDAMHVTEVTPRLLSFALVSSGEHTAGAMVVGIDPEAEDRITSLRKKVSEGSYLKEDDPGILLAGGLSRRLGAGPGDTVVLLGQGYHGVTAAGKFPVTGIVEFPSPDLNSGVTYVTLKRAQVLYASYDRATAIVGMVDSQKHLHSVILELVKRFDKGYEVMSWDEMHPELVQVIQTDNAGGIVMLWIIYIVIGFGILGTVLMMTLERTREFGMLIAIGLKRMRLAFIILLESMMLSLIAAVVGIVLAIPLLVYMYYHPITFGGKAAEITISYGFEPILPFSVDPMIFCVQAGTVLIIAILVTVYPIIRVFRLRPVNALRTG